ncbi:histidine kinase [Flavobacterium sp.]|uniref:histidine kinase n=1 Tax=Flavobacterium sp. TaxID=239 RepID=UPI00286D345C|nr:histidine kinase [Flavobacterium sp.]
METLLYQYKGNTNPLINAKLSYYQAKFNYEKGNDSLAEIYLKKSIPTLSQYESDNYLMLIDGISIQGYLEYNASNYNTAKQYYKQAVYFGEKYFTTDTISQKYSLAAFEGYGSVNRILNDYKTATKYIRKTIELAEKHHDYERIITANSDLALVYTDTKKYDLALFHIKKAESLALTKRKDLLPLVYNHFASVYHAKMDLNQTLFYFKKEYEADPETSETDKAINLSLVYLELHELALAKPLMVFLEKEYLDNRLLDYDRIQTLERLIKYYTQTRDFKKVAFYFDLYGQELDEFTRDEQLATTEDFIKKYDLKAKEDHINLLNQKNQLVENQLSQKNIAILIIVLALLLIVAIGLSLYFQQRNKKLQVEKQLLITKDTLLRSQMEPHFVFNALSSLQSLIYENQHQLAVKYLSKFARLLRLSLEHSRMKFVPFADEIESIENYLELQQMRFSNQFDYTISGNMSDLENNSIPPLMIQPFVENAIYHGFANLDYKGELKIAFEKHTDFVCFTIADNGSGIEVSKNNTDKTKTSLSTTITIERLKSLVDSKNKIDFLEITNNPNAKSGTVVVLRMPYIQTL